MTIPERTNVKRASWLLAFLVLLIPLETSAQIQDIHTLRIVTQAFDKVKSDNKIRQNTMVAQKTHRIDNLKNGDKIASFEKMAIYKAYTRTVKGEAEYVEELVDIRPAGSDPPSGATNFERLLDSFLTRSYFLINSEKEVIEGRPYTKIHFWPRDSVPPPEEDVDRVLSKAVGTLYVDEKTSALRRINGRIREAINVLFLYNMERLDFNIEFSEQNRLVLIQSTNAIAKYQYRPPWTLFRTIKRYQLHNFWYDYGPVK